MQKIMKLIGQRVNHFLDDKNNVCFLRILLIALLLRVIIMPFFGHIDVLSEARRVYFWAENNIFIDTISRNTSMFIEAMFLKATLFLLPDSEAMFFLKDMTRTTASLPHSFEFVSYPTIFRTLFVLKMPFLVFDLLTAVILYKYHDGSKSALRSVKVWLFNPITIFAFYVFGRFESIPIFFIACAIYSLKKRRVLLAAVCVALCVNGREMMILYAPLFVLVLLTEPLVRVSLARKITALAIVLLSVILVTQLYVPLLDNIQNSAGMAAGSVVQDNRIQNLFSFVVHSIMVLPFVYTLIAIWVVNSTESMHRKMLLSGALAMLSFFAFSGHTAHFTSWMVVFPAFYVGYSRSFIRPFAVCCVAWFVYWCFLTDLGVFTHWLASPFSLHFVGIQNIPYYYDSMVGKVGCFDLKMIIAIMRALFVATLFYLAFQMLFYVSSNNESQ